MPCVQQRSAEMRHAGRSSKQPGMAGQAMPRQSPSVLVVHDAAHLAPAKRHGFSGHAARREAVAVSRQRTRRTGLKRERGADFSRHDPIERQLLQALQRPADQREAEVTIHGRMAVAWRGPRAFGSKAIHGFSNRSFSFEGQTGEQGGKQRAVGL